MNEQQLAECRALTDGVLLVQVVCHGQIVWSHSYANGRRIGLSNRVYRETRAIPQHH